MDIYDPWDADSVYRQTRLAMSILGSATPETAVRAASEAIAALQGMSLAELADRRTREEA